MPQDLASDLAVSPALAGNWHALLASELALTPQLRTLAAAAVAMLHRDASACEPQRLAFMAAHGRPEQWAALRVAHAAAGRIDVFDASERAVLQLAVEMTRDVRVSQGCLSAARSALARPRELVEAVAVIAIENMNSRLAAVFAREP